MQFAAHVVLTASTTQVVPAQHAAGFAEQSPLAKIQAQYCAGAQTAPPPLTSGSQHPDAHCSLPRQLAAHTLTVGLATSLTHVLPLQHDCGSPVQIPLAGVQAGAPPVPLVPPTPGVAPPVPGGVPPTPGVAPPTPPVVWVPPVAPAPPAPPLPELPPVASLLAFPLPPTLPVAAPVPGSGFCGGAGGDPRSESDEQADARKTMIVRSVRMLATVSVDVSQRKADFDRRVTAHRNHKQNGPRQPSPKRRSPGPSGAGDWGFEREEWPAKLARLRAGVWSQRR